MWTREESFLIVIRAAATNIALRIPERIPANRCHSVSVGGNAVVSAVAFDMVSFEVSRVDVAFVNSEVRFEVGLSICRFWIIIIISPRLCVTM